MTDLRPNLMEVFAEGVAMDRAERIDTWLYDCLRGLLSDKDMSVVTRQRKQGVKGAIKTVQLLKKRRIYCEQVVEPHNSRRYFMIRKGQNTVALKEF
jgi:adenosylmethionine-8-amino-7-oxononanoate aminotransferase